MTDDLELCTDCSKGHLRPTAEAATAGENTKNLMSINLQIDIWFTHVYPWYNYFQIKFQIQRVL